MEETKTTTAKTEETKTKVKKFKNDDLIPCKSITSGELLMVGEKTNILYKWSGYGDIEDVEYQDLIYEARSARNSYVTFPRFIILDNNFIDQNKQLLDLYKKIYSSSDLEEIINLPVKEIKKIIPTLPDGIVDSMKSIVSTMIRNGRLDSVSKIKAFDELFETSMLQTLLED